MKKVFFNDPHKLANLFTAPRELSYMDSKFFNNQGMKANEAFDNDIMHNLVNWSYDKTAIFYETKEFWYVYQLTEINGGHLISMTRYRLGTWERVDTWQNVHSCCCGSEWLLAHHRDKYIELYHVGR